MKNVQNVVTRYSNTLTRAARAQLKFARFSKLIPTAEAALDIPAALLYYRMQTIPPFNQQNKPVETRQSTLSTG